MLKWKTYESYNDAKDSERCLYVFKKGRRYLYIGKAKNFGGPSGRYAYGYRYLVQALLESGAKLKIATLTQSRWAHVDDYERTLISACKDPGLLNERRTEPVNRIKGLRLP